MSSLADRRDRVDLIQTQRILHMYDWVEEDRWFERVNTEREVTTRLTSCKQNLKLNSCNLDIRKYFFSQRVVNKWNSLTRVSDPDPDPDPPGSTTFGRIRIRIRIHFYPNPGSGTGSGSTPSSFPGSGSGIGSTLKKHGFGSGQQQNKPKLCRKKESLINI